MVIYKYRKENKTMKPIRISILATIALTGCTVRQICTAPVITYNSAGTKCVEYTKKCICIGNGKFIRPDGNIYKVNDNKNYKTGKKYLVYFNNMGTDDISDDIIVAVR